MKILHPIQLIHVLALDAPLIGFAWHQYFAHTYGIAPAFNNQSFVLVAALWLGYMVDRLFDVSHKAHLSFPSKRHQFAQKYGHYLWPIWGIVLAFSISYSLISLNNEKIVACLALFFAIVLYNLINQCLLRQGFHKEVCVALLFSSACLVLLNAPFQWHDFFNLSLIIFLNCILLSKKEQHADEQIGLSSLAHRLSNWTLTALILGSNIFFALTLADWWNPFFFLSGAMLILHLLNNRYLSLSDESYRLLVECFYCATPLCFLLA
tara:strand:- start:291 stop:1085 length:795 start_codon:yes stop_codon:yes gene_type:complete